MENFLQLPHLIWINSDDVNDGKYKNNCSYIISMDGLCDPIVLRVTQFYLILQGGEGYFAIDFIL